MRAMFSSWSTSHQKQDNNSTLVTVFPVIFAKYSDIKDNYSAFFGNLVDDLNKLYQDGHTMDLSDGTQYKFHAILASVVADSLAYHNVFGLMRESPICHSKMDHHAEIYHESLPSVSN